MDLERLDSLVKDFKRLPIETREPTIFDIGARGHFENPMTEVLSFFCDSSGVHEMENLVASCFVNILRNHDKYKALPLPQADVKAQREVSTKNNKRIDLLLTSDQWVIAIENKINHIQVNPFQEYEEYVNALTTLNKSDDEIDANGKKPVFVILSPDGKVDNPLKNTNWCGISFKQLSEELKSGLQKHFMSSSFNKWALVLKDFILHMENLVEDNKYGLAHENFALNNINSIATAWNLLKDTLLSVYPKALSLLEQRNLYSESLVPQKNTWFGLPATILENKISNNRAVLFASQEPIDNAPRNSGKYIYIQIHVKHKDKLIPLDEVSPGFGTKDYDSWRSESDKMNAYRWPASSQNTNDLAAELVAAYSLISKI